MSKYTAHLSAPAIQQIIHDALPNVADDWWTISPEGTGYYYTLKYAPIGREQQPIAQHLFLEELRGLQSVLNAIIEEADKALAQLEETPLPCVYHTDCHGEGKHQCPACKQWYCDECRKMWLPIDPMFWVETAMMCPSCHYERYGRARA